MKNKCIFTYITGDYDNLIEPAVVTPGWDYLCFTDNPNITSDTWEIRSLREEDMQIKCPKRRGNAVVMQYYKYISDHYDTCMIVDGNIKINTNLDAFIVDIGYSNENHDFLIPSHPDRNCIYNEAKVIIDLHKDSCKNVESHVNKLKREGFPKSYGLHATSLFILNTNSKITHTLFDTWHTAYTTHPSKRDQMTFDYARWILETKSGVSPSICRCNFFYSNDHSKPLGVYDVLFSRARHVR